MRVGAVFGTRADVVHGTGGVRRGAVHGTGGQVRGEAAHGTGRKVRGISVHGMGGDVHGGATTCSRMYMIYVPCVADGKNDVDTRAHGIYLQYTDDVDQGNGMCIRQ